MINLPVGPSQWLDIFSAIGAVTCLEAAITGSGRTVHHGRSKRWEVAAWLRPLLGITGLILVVFACFDFRSRF